MPCHSEVRRGAASACERRNRALQYSRFLHFGRNYAVGIGDGLTALHLVDVLHSFGHLAPHRILTVEPRRIAKANEELAVAGIRALGARHGDGAAYVTLLGEFRLELAARAAGAGTLRAAGLRHEAIDHPMKGNPIVK